MRWLRPKRFGRGLAVLALVIMAAAALSLVDPLRDASAQTALPELTIDVVNTTANPSTVAEGGELTFTISASDPTLDRDLTVNLQVTEDTSMGQRYLDSAERGTKRVILPAGLVTTTYTVKTAYTMITEGFKHDDVDEPDGTVTVMLRPGTGYTVGATDAASGTVTDNDPTVVDMILEDTTAPENGGKVDIKYRIVNGPLKAGQTIAFKTGTKDWGPGANTGTYNTDYTMRLKPGAGNRGVTLTTTAPYSEQTPLLTMTGAGVREATLELTAIDDSVMFTGHMYVSIGTAADGVFVQQLGSVAKQDRSSSRKVGHPTLVTVVRAQELPETRSELNVIWFVDDEDTDDIAVGFLDATYSGRESANVVQTRILFGKTHNQDIQIPLLFPAGTGTGKATAGVDYRTTTTQTVLKPSLTSDVAFPIIDDRRKEGNETFTVTIDFDALPDLKPDDPNSTGWSKTGSQTITITIVDDDGDVHASIRALDTTATEGSASDKARFRVNLDSVRGATGPLTDGDAATINFDFGDHVLGEDFDVKLLTEHPTLSSGGASVKFNPNAVTPAQNTPRFADFELVAREDNDAIDDVVTVTLAGDTGIPSGVGSGTGVTVTGSGISTGTSSGEAVITLRDNDREAMGLRLRGGLTGPVQDDDGVFSIGEGSNATFFLGLTEAPTADVTATATISSGGYAAAITSGASHTLEPHTTTWMCALCPWRVEFRYNYNTQSGTLHGKEIAIAATQDIATVPTDDVTLRIVLASDDKNYDGAVYEYPIKVIDNEQPISVGLVSTSAVNLPESHHGRIKLAVRASRPVHAALTPRLTWADPSDTGHFDADQEIDIAVEPIPVGGTMGYIYLDAKDDNIAEVEASATATLALDSPPANVTVDENRNTFLLRHSDDDRLYIRLIERRDTKGTADLSDDTFTPTLYFTRPLDYALEIFLKGKASADNRTLSPSSSHTSGPHEIIINGGLDPYSAIVVRTLGENYTFFDRQAIVVSDGIQLIDHDDDIPVIGPPLVPQSDEVSPQGEVHDALTLGTGGGNGGESLNDRVNGISVSDVTPDGFTLGWTAANGADSYRVRYWQDENAASVVPVAGTTYTVTGLDAETEYSAQILAVVNGSVVTNKSSSVITVTTAAAPAPAAAAEAEACNLPSDAISVAEVTGWRDALDPIRAAAGVKRWNRILATLGENTGETAMTTAQAKAVSNWLKNTRWDRTARTLEAMDQCDDPAPQATPPPPPTPEISIASDGDVTEGTAASFTISASPTPAADLSVNVSVSQSGDYGVTTGAQTITIPTTGSYTLTVATTDDSTDEADGSVTTTVSSGTGYTVSTSASAATAAVSDNDEPPQACNLPTDAITVAEVTGWRDALDTTKAAAGIKRWNRVLATLGVDTGEKSMSAVLAQAVSNWLKNTRWDRTARTLDAMEQCNN